LPIPGGPTSVSRRTSTRFRACSTLAISSSRPRISVGGDGRAEGFDGVLEIRRWCCGSGCGRRVSGVPLRLADDRGLSPMIDHSPSASRQRAKPRRAKRRESRFRSESSSGAFSPIYVDSCTSPPQASLSISRSSEPRRAGTQRPTRLLVRPSQSDRRPARNLRLSSARHRRLQLRGRDDEMPIPFSVANLVSE
jgi:hypothetical protein